MKLHGDENVKVTSEKILPQCAGSEEFVLGDWPLSIIQLTQLFELKERVDLISPFKQ